MQTKDDLHFADCQCEICNLQTEAGMSKPQFNFDAAAVLERMKAGLGLETDIQLANALGISNKTISSWRSRNSIPLDTILDVSLRTSDGMDYLVLGRESAPDDYKQEDYEAFLLFGEAIYQALTSESPSAIAHSVDWAIVEERATKIANPLVIISAFLRRQRLGLTLTEKETEFQFADMIRKTLEFESMVFELRKALARLKLTSPRT